MVTTQVLLVSPSAAPAGAEEVFFNLAVHLRGSRDTNIRVVVFENGPLVERLRSAGVSTAVYAMPRLRQPLKLLKALRALSRHIRVFAPNVIFSSQSKGHLYSYLASNRLSVRRVWRQVSIPEPATVFDRLATLAPADKVICNSDLTEQKQRALPGCRATMVIHPGVDPTLFSPEGSQDLRDEFSPGASVLMIGLVGRLQEWKGQRQFIEAVGLLKAAGSRSQFIIVGGAVLGTETGEFETSLRDLVAELSLEGSVIFTGHRTDMPDVFRSLDIVINASEAEPFGNVVLQAMSVGRPVVAVGRGGPAEIIVDGISGILLTDNNPESIAQAVSQLESDEQLRTALGAGGRMRVIDKFSLEQASAAFEEQCMGRRA